MTIEQSILRLVFPEQIFKWFKLEEGTKDEKTIRVVFEEKIFLR